MKVAFLVRRFTTTGGAERYAMEVAKRLTEHCELHIYAQEILDEVPGANFHLLKRIAEKPRYLNQMHFDIQVSNLNKHFDVVHSHERVRNFDVLTIHCPTFRGGYLGENVAPWKRSWRQISCDLSPRIAYYLWLEKQQFTPKCGRRLIAVSEHVMKDVVSAYPALHASDFDYAYPGVDSDKFQVSNQSVRLAERKRLGLDDKLTICFVGTEFERKGLATLVEAMAILKDKPLKLLVAGGGDIGYYTNMVINLGIRDKVVFLGLVKNVQAVYAASDIYVLPTLSDPCPMAPLEAMASGLPAIISNANITGVSEHIKKSEALLLEDPRNAQELASKILALLNPDVRGEYIKRGLELVQNITWNDTARLTLNSYYKSIEAKKANL